MSSILNSHAGFVVGTFVCWCALALADDPKPDYSDVRGKLELLEDGKHHYLGYVMAKDPAKSRWFYGDGKTLTELATPSVSRPNVNRMHITWSFGDPRYRSKTTEYVTDFDTNEFVVTCDKRKTAFKRVEAAAAAKLAAAATFHEVVLWRTPVLFGRDDDGIYYYVDRPGAHSNETDSTDFAMYIGKRGAVRKVAITDVVQDSVGSLFMTAGGKLRLTHKTSTLDWIGTDQKAHPLSMLDGSGADSSLVYNQLGAYNHERYGTPCDDL